MGVQTFAMVGILTLCVAIFAMTTSVVQGICEKGEKVTLERGLTMVCKGDNTWIPKGKKVRSGKKPGGPPCQDSASPDQCQADRGHCNQFTEAGSEMERVCPGTCDSCDGCRCQDSAQWHQYCPYWAQYCSSTGVLGEWMTANCRKTCGQCKCKCCSYQGKSHKLGERIPLPDKCGELVCEEGLIAEASPLLAGAVAHAVSHPDELTLVFRSVHDGADCCVLDNSTMVAEGWSGEVDLNGTSITGICCRGVLSAPIKDIEYYAKTTTTTTTTSTTTSTSTTSTTTTTTDNRGELLYKADGRSFYKTPVPYGVTLVGGVVADTCEKSGLKASCFGPSGDKYNSERCVVTKLTDVYNGYIMRDLAKILCNEKDGNPRKCSKLYYLFLYMKNYPGGECGVLPTAWCAQGRSYTSTQEKPYYALCVQ